MPVWRKYILMIIANAIIAAIITIKFGYIFSLAYAGGQLYMGLYFEIFKRKN